MNSYKYKGREVFLKRVRVNRSQVDFASYLGISQTTLSRWENEWKDRFLTEVLAQKLHDIPTERAEPKKRKSKAPPSSPAGASVPEGAAPSALVHVPRTAVADGSGGRASFALLQRAIQAARRFAERLAGEAKGRDPSPPPASPVPAHAPAALPAGGNAPVVPSVVLVPLAQAPAALPSGGNAPRESPAALVVYQPVRLPRQPFTTPNGRAPFTPSAPAVDAETEEEQSGIAQYIRKGAGGAAAPQGRGPQPSADGLLIQGELKKIGSMVAILLVAVIILGITWMWRSLPARTEYRAPHGTPDLTDMAQTDGGVLEVPKWMAPEGADGGTPVLPPAQPAVKQFKGQKLAPCDAMRGEIELAKACWWALELNISCESPNIEANGKCYAPVLAKLPPPPVTNTPQSP